MNWPQQDLIAVTVDEERNAALQYLDQLPYSLSDAIRQTLLPQEGYLSSSGVQLDFLGGVTTTTDDAYCDIVMWNADVPQIETENVQNSDENVVPPPEFARTDSDETVASHSVISNISSADAPVPDESPATKIKRRSERRKEQNRHAQRLYRERKEQQLRDATDRLHVVMQDLVAARATIAKLEVDLKANRENPSELQLRNESLLKQLSGAEDRIRTFESKWASLRSKLQQNVDNM